MIIKQHLKYLLGELLIRRRRLSNFVTIFLHLQGKSLVKFIIRSMLARKSVILAVGIIIVRLVFGLTFLFVNESAGGIYIKQWPSVKWKSCQWQLVWRVLFARWRWYSQPDVITGNLHGDWRNRYARSPFVDLRMLQVPQSKLTCAARPLPGYFTFTAPVPCWRSLHLQRWSQDDFGESKLNRV